MAPTQEPSGPLAGLDLGTKVDAVQRSDAKVFLWILATFLVTVTTSVLLVNA